MRIATAHAYDASLASLQKRQQQLSEAQQQLTSGKRVLRPSDDPAAAAVAERALAAASRSDTQMRALDASRFAMQLTESALGESGELLQQARELVVSAGNSTFTDAERLDLAERLRGLRGALFAVGNRSDGAGRYLFGGQSSDGPPLLDGPGGVSFNGVAGQADAAADRAMPLSADGRAIWLLASDPANPAQSLSVFDAMDRLVDDLATAGRTPAQVAQTVSLGLAEIDASAATLSAGRSRAGETLNRLDALGSRLSQDKLDAQQARSEAEDLDMVQAISDFQNRQTGYQAALQTYSIVQRMSLFDYLR
ncbi:MAG: flagellar hook-associated protein FlgL [Rubrivivax sp.]|nr:flagellar hook-associated protein FlgL [Rubrivivax sp.]